MINRYRFVGCNGAILLVLQPEGMGINFEHSVMIFTIMPSDCLEMTLYGDKGPAAHDGDFIRKLDLEDKGLQVHKLHTQMDTFCPV